MQPFGLDSTSIFSTADTNPNNDSYHELIEQPVAGNRERGACRHNYPESVEVQKFVGV
jgi:hypothetical protein